MIEEYLEYWGLTNHPFLLAPDSRMMCVTGQYYECLERVKYAINTGKGGVLIVSEDAGLGKTTLLLKLIDDMKGSLGDAFRYAYVDHPTLSSSQMIAQIAGEISGLSVGEDKLKNLAILKDALIQAKEQGGRSIIVVDEGQLLCEAPDVLQELRILINLTYRNEYLHTFILSGQRTLWHTIKNMPEFWQRLPVRYYFVPLKLQETRELIQYRLRQTGLEEGREIFSEDALEIIHRYSRGSPRTVIALSDLSLLVGYTNQAGKVGFKEVSKAINAMSGQGESLPYVREENRPERGPSLHSVSTVERGPERPPWKRPEYPESGPQAVPAGNKAEKAARPRLVFIVLAVLSIIVASIAGYHYLSPSLTTRKIAATEAPKPEPPAKVVPDNEVPKPDAGEAAPPADSKADVSGSKGETKEAEKPGIPERTATVVADGAIIRSAPDLRSPRIGLIPRNETIKIVGDQEGKDGRKWYMVILYGTKEGWISDSVVAVR